MIPSKKIKQFYLIHKYDHDKFYHSGPEWTQV